jgi:hypothetical protein
MENIMIRSLFIFVLFVGLNSHATELKQIQKPTSVKVAAVSKSWEKIYTPNMCYPDAATFKITNKSSINLQGTVLAAAIALNKDLKSVTSFRRVESTKDIYKTTEAILSDMGIMKDDHLSEQLYRVGQNPMRQIYEATVIDGNKKLPSEGTILAIYDLENLELVLLTTDDAFEPSSCE